MSAGDLVIRSGHVLTMDPELGDIPDGDVLVAGGRIAAVGTGLDAPGAREIDARGMIVAGLINGTAQQEFTCTARQALALGTIDGARSLGLDAVTGSLTPGKRADLIVVATGHPNLGVLTDPAGLLVTAAQPGNVDTVLADGQILKRGGTLVTLDGERVSAQAREALAGVRARAS